MWLWTATTPKFCRKKALVSCKLVLNYRLLSDLGESIILKNIKELSSEFLVYILGLFRKVGHVTDTVGDLE